MKKNMGLTDKLIRLSAVVLIAILYFTAIISGTLAIVLLVVAGLFLLTSLMSFCPIYTILGINSCPVEKK